MEEGVPDSKHVSMVIEPVIIHQRNMGKKRAIEIEKKQHDTVRDIRYTHTQKDRDKKESGV